MPIVVAHQTIDAVGDGVATYAQRYPKGCVIPGHRHRSGQLIYARAGSMTVRAGPARWLVLPQRAVWMPPTVGHAIRCDGDVAMRSLYFGGAMTAGLPVQAVAFGVTSLLRELVLEAVERGAVGRRFEHLVALVGDEIGRLPALPPGLPEPRERALRRIWAGLQEDPADPRTLAGWARTVGASERTLARRFLAETGLGFRAWRRLVRMYAARDRLLAGDPPGRVAPDCGYDSPSAFAAAFKAKFGHVPSRTAPSPE